MNFDADWQKAASQMQEAFRGMMQPQGAQHAPVQFDAAKLQLVQKDYIDGATALWNQSLQAGNAIPPTPDRRFSAAAWNDNPVSKFSAAAYLQIGRAHV